MNKLKAFFVSSIFLLCGVFMNSKSVSARGVNVQLNIYPTSYEILKLSGDRKISVPLLCDNMGSGLPPTYQTLLHSIVPSTNKIICNLDEDTFNFFECICCTANELKADCESLADGTYDFDLESYELASNRLAAVLNKIFEILFVASKSS